jgi:hypothetical protein
MPHGVTQNDTACPDQLGDNFTPGRERLPFAEHAVEAPNHRYSIADSTITPGYVGSIICSLLHHLKAEFEYQKGRVLVYHPNKRR